MRWNEVTGPRKADPQTRLNERPKLRWVTGSLNVCIWVEWYIRAYRSKECRQHELITDHGQAARPSGRKLAAYC
jgi:hypothetical protein